jgi:hypothetical protein
MTEIESEPSLWTVLARLWRGAPTGLRRLAQTMWTSGIVLVVASLIVDPMPIWQRHQFLTNLISNVIGSIFAVPFALLVLSGFSSYQAELSVSRRIDVKVRAAKAGLAGVLEPLQQPAAVRADEVQAAMNRLWEYTPEANRDAANVAAAAVQALSDFTDLSELELFEHNIAQVRTHWELLREALAERVGSDGDWHLIGELQRTSGDLEAVVSAHRRHLERRTFPVNGRAKGAPITAGKLEVWRPAAQDLMVSSRRLADMLDELARLCAIGGTTAGRVSRPAS